MSLIGWMDKRYDLKAIAKLQSKYPGELNVNGFYNLAVRSNFQLSSLAIAGTIDGEYCVDISLAVDKRPSNRIYGFLDELIDVIFD